jgi:hypothetical protein
MMSPAEKKLAAFLLRMASEEFSNHGCNDLDLVKDVGLTPEESFELRKRYHVYNRSPEVDVQQESPTRHWTGDFAMMSFMAHRILEG